MIEVKASPRNTGALGSFGEAAAEVFLSEVMGHEVVADESSRDKPQGVDLVTFDPAKDRIIVVEVKTTGREAVVGPKLAKTTSTRQMSDAWVADPGASRSGTSRAAEAGLDVVQFDDIGGAVAKMVAHVNIATGTVSLHEMNGDRVDPVAAVVVGLEDLARFSDALREKS
ncbi:hypothetical protein SBI67_14310 [Mycolicibacterium sp. 120266]|uniref:hypothetical protein n=1 Tax=Mycolicibacterium sp. 120266 TaxID=3090601 RepID=UPI00299DAEC4|nr:hypothetical protein [Mycolicibacterium sp. 120266]MDX1873294.1 hypothetical protein [Mycolicibacterium sp. 120266]